jgi:steroid 5-alpha reductase family enzyme
MSIWVRLGVIWCLAAVLMTLGWQWQRRRHNAGIVDVIWAGGLAAAAIWLGLSGDGAILPRAILGTFGGLWGGRLALHLWKRVSHEAEDGRYRYLREHWQGSQIKLFLFFQFQALLIVLFALPFLAVSYNSREGFTGWTVLGMAIWLISSTGESLADMQLARFRANPANRGLTCRAGMWHYSRHPNYFFEWLHWLTYVALAVGSPILWLTVPGPVLMYVFLRWVSGIPFTEAQALRTRGLDYRLYQQQTPMFFPWIPNEVASESNKRGS